MHLQKGKRRHVCSYGGPTHYKPQTEGMGLPTVLEIRHLRMRKDEELWGGSSEAFLLGTFMSRVQ